MGSTTYSNQGMEEMHPSASPSPSPLLPAHGVSHGCCEEYSSDHRAVNWAAQSWFDKLVTFCGMILAGN